MAVLVENIPEEWSGDKTMVADTMRAPCAAGGCLSFKTRVSSVNAAAASQLYILANTNGT